MRKIKAQAVAVETRVWDTVTMAVSLWALIYALSVFGR
jgi:hypothetical protein